MAAAMHEYNQPPPWLREVGEHELLAVDADTLAAYTHLPAEVHRRSYWIKASSFHALHRAVVAASLADVQAELGKSETPLCVFLMPATPLADAQRIFTLMTGETPLVLDKVEPSADADEIVNVDQVVLCFHSLVDRQCKVALFHAAQRALVLIRKARELVAGSLTIYERRSCGLTAAELQEVATPDELAAADKLFARRKAGWRELASRLTLMGYAPPSPPADADAHGSADGGGGNANSSHLIDRSVGRNN